MSASDHLGPQFEQPGLFPEKPYAEPEGAFTPEHHEAWNDWFTNSVRAEQHMAGGRGKNLEQQEPEYRRGVARPGGGAMPGQLVMGARDLSENEPVMSTSVDPHTGYAVEHRQPLMVEGHGTVHDPGMPFTHFRDWGPQFGHSQMWSQHATLTTLKADSPVQSAQPGLRYDPATGGRWRRSLDPRWNDSKSPTPSTRTGDTPGSSHSEGIQGDLDFSDPNKRPAILKHGGTHYVVDGHHRLYEARSRGMTDIPVRILDADRLMSEHGYSERGHPPGTPSPGGMFANPAFGARAQAALQRQQPQQHLVPSHGSEIAPAQHEMMGDLYSALGMPADAAMRRSMAKRGRAKRS